MFADPGSEDDPQISVLPGEFETMTLETWSRRLGGRASATLSHSLLRSSLEAYVRNPATTAVSPSTPPNRSQSRVAVWANPGGPPRKDCPELLAFPPVGRSP